MNDRTVLPLRDAIAAYITANAAKWINGFDYKPMPASCEAAADAIMEIVEASKQSLQDVARGVERGSTSPDSAFSNSGGSEFAATAATEPLEGDVPRECPTCHDMIVPIPDTMPMDGLTPGKRADARLAAAREWISRQRYSDNTDEDLIDEVGHAFTEGAKWGQYRPVTVQAFDVTDAMIEAFWTAYVPEYGPMDGNDDRQAVREGLEAAFRAR